MKGTDTMELKNVELDGINGGDYPDFCDAYVTYAEHPDGTPLTDKELDDIPRDVIHELVWNRVH